MGKLKGAVYGKLKSQNKITDDLQVQMLDFEKEFIELDFETRKKGRELTAWQGALSLTIRFTMSGNTVITRKGAAVQNGHEEKLDLKETYDYVSTKISNYYRDKDS